MNDGLPYRRILISRLRFIGDVVLTTPMIASVRAALPGAFIAYLGEKRAVSLLEHNPSLDEVIPYDFDRSSVREQIRIAFLLRRMKFDLAIDLFSNPRSALLMFLSGAPARVGLDRKGRGKLFTVRVRCDGTSRTAIEFHNQFLRAVGITPVSVKTHIELTDGERQEGKALILRACGSRGMHHPLIGIHPGASWPAKKWDAERYGQLGKRLVSELGASVIATAGPGEANLLIEVNAAAGGAVMMLPVMPVRQLAAVLSLCDVYVSNDAGPMHIATAVNTPTIGLFGPGEEDIWFPYDAADGHRALRKNVPCHPCHLDVCNREGAGYMECMKLLSTDDVFSAVESSLQARGSRSFR